MAAVHVNVGFASLAVVRKRVPAKQCLVLSKPAAGERYVAAPGIRKSKALWASDLVRVPGQGRQDGAQD